MSSNQRVLNDNKASLKEIVRRFNVLITAIIVLGFSAAVTSGTFFEASNLLNVAERASIIGIVAIGQTLVILSGAMDLSVGGIMSVSYTSLIVYSATGMPYGIAILLSICTGLLFGVINGIIVITTNIPPLLVTLSTMMIGFSVSNTILGTLQLRYSELQMFINSGLGLDQTMARLFPTLIWLFLSVVSVIVLSKTRLGVNIFAVGGGAKAAFLAGVRSERIRVSVFIISGFTSAIAALIFAYRVGFLMPSSSDGYLILSIAAVVLGGTNINGGEGSIYGSFFGAVVIAALFNVLNILQVDPFIQYAIMGFIMMFIVFNMSFLSNRK